MALDFFVEYCTVPVNNLGDGVTVFPAYYSPQNKRENLVQSDDSQKTTHLRRWAGH